MKTILTSILLFVVLIGNSSADHITPKIKGDPSSKTGKTDNPAVRCILKEDGYRVRGELIVDKKFMSAKFGPTLEAWEDRQLVFSVEVEGRAKDGKIHYYFTIKRSLLKRARFSMFTRSGGMWGGDGMFNFDLSNVRVHKNDDDDPFAEPEKK
ncbi:MAG: hypothetical protein H7A51_13620 [Akkermansiaceae bacterium]|nr:hypothetical protein [Akkermansiaceae bacterium]